MRVILACTLLLMLSSPGWTDTYQEQVKLLEADEALHDHISDIAESLRAGSIDSERAGNLWRKLLPEANRNKKSAAKLGGDPLSEGLRALTRLQFKRLDGLIRAADVETWHGFQLAQLAWVKQKTNFNRYKKQRDEVRRTLHLLNKPSR